MQEAKLKKLLDQQYLTPKGVFPLKFLIAIYGIERVGFNLQEYSKKRINYEYIKLKKPKKNYYVLFGNGEALYVPKMVYDYCKRILDGSNRI